MDKGIEALISKVKKQTESFDTVVLKEDEAKALIAALELARRYSKKRDEENHDLMLTIGRLRVEREKMEADHNGMMQLSNELAEMKRKQKPAYDVTEFGQFSAWGMGGELRTAITLFRFDGNPANRKGEMVPKFMLQGIINSIQEHCDKMGDESMIEIMVGAVGTVEESE